MFHPCTNNFTQFQFRRLRLFLSQLKSLSFQMNFSSGNALPETYSGNDTKVIQASRISDQVDHSLIAVWQHTNHTKFRK